MLTVNGDLRLTRKRFATEPKRAADREAHQPETLLPAGLFVDDDRCRHRVSVNAREFFCRMNLDAAGFKNAAATLEHFTGVLTSSERLRQVVQEEGKAVQKVQQAGSRTPNGEPSGALAAAWTALEAHVAPADAGQADQLSFDFLPRRVYASVDGVMAPRVSQAEKDKRRKAAVKKRRKMPAEQRARLGPLPPKSPGADCGWKEIKATLHFDQHGRHSHASLTTGNHRGAGGLIDRDARKLRVGLADEKVAIADGAVWIRHRLAEAETSYDAVILDFYHFSEHVHKAGRAVFGDKAPEGVSWATGLLVTAKERGPAAFFSELHEFARSRRGKARRALDALGSYAGERRSGIDYPAYLKRGWHIGSGLMEASCKTLPRRLKGSGMRWDRRGTDAIGNLAGLRQNEQWDTYWKQAA